ncbi:MAG TPA: N-acetylglucosamine-6-phosphate deacetylase [Blastocatellia bacterium]
MTETLLKNARLVLDDGIVEGHILVKGGVIAAVYLRDQELPVGLADNQQLDLAGAYLAPGFIDIHIHGSHGIDILEAGPEDLLRLAQALLQEGITGYVPTIVPINEPEYRRTLAVISKSIDIDKSHGRSYSQVLGAHFEGPFVSEKRCGALHREFFRTYDGNTASLEIFCDSDGAAKHGDAGGGSPGFCRLMTIAPEIHGGIELISDLTRAGTRCFIGHTVADFETLNRALAAGAVHITHFPNALEPLHNRRPGAVGWGLLTDGITLDSIADYHHVHPEVLKLIYRMKGPDRMALISDAIPPTGLPEGEYIVWGDRIEIKNGKTQLVGSGGGGHEGTIAGSVITLREAVVNAIGIGIRVHEAIRMASLVPARAAGLDRRVGSIAVGKLANLTALDEAMNVRLAIVEGEMRLR